MRSRIIQLDGLRALAFLAVMFRHLGVAPSGYMGVDVFFVLSGFLVTSILRRRRTEPNRFGHFYANRARRILPPYLICLAFAAIFFSVAWAKVWPYYTFALENVATLRHPFEIGSLGPLWSLGIEEQFYLVWPLLVFTLPRKYLLTILTAILLLCPILRAVATPHVASIWSIYEVTFFRLDGISAGAMIALLVEAPVWVNRFKRVSWPLFLAPLAVLIVASRAGYTMLGNTVLYNALGFSVVILMSLGILTTALYSQGPVFRVLTLAPLRYLGRISYMAYLIHTPILELLKQFNRTHHINRGAQAMSVVLTLAFASLTWYCIELPIQNWGRPKQAPVAELSPASTAIAA